VAALEAAASPVRPSAARPDRQPDSALTHWDPGRSPAHLPLEYRRLLGDLAAKSTDQGGLSSQQASALERLLPRYDDWCAELAASPLPDTLQHDDLHSNNVCWPGTPADASSARIIDWGDSCMGYPLGTMLATLNSIAFHAGMLHNDRGNIEDPRVLGIRDAYLEAFTGLGSHRELVRWVALARSTGCLTRALSWERAVQHAAASVAVEYEFPVRAWLMELLETWANVD
jgi:hypothetical protein